MPVLTQKRFDENLHLAVSSISSAKAALQECLIFACFYAFKDGNTSPLNNILEKTRGTKAIEINRITKWVCTHAKIARVKDDKFVLNKKTRDEACVTNEKDFEHIEADLRSLTWYNVERETKPKDWELDAYLDGVLKTLERHTKDVNADVDAIEMARKAIMQAKATAAVANYEVA